MTPAAVRRMIEQLAPPAARLGTVTTGGSTPTVALDGGESVVVRYYTQGMTFAVTDRVLMQRVGGGIWVATSKLTTPAAVAAAVTRRFSPTRAWWKGAPLSAGPSGWTYQFEYVTNGADVQLVQGQDFSQGGSDGITTPKAPVKYGTVLYWGTLASLIPAGATILDVSLAFTRQRAVFSQPPLTYPRVYGHAYTDGSPPTTANEPAFVGGFGPLTGIGAVAAGQGITISLPSTWVSAWQASTIRGLTLYSDQRSDVIFSTGDPDDVQLIVTYQPVPE